MQRQIVPQIGFADLIGARVGVAVEQRLSGHHHRRGAEPALQSVHVHEPLLDRSKNAALLEVFHRADRPAVGHRRQHRARFHRLAVHPHDANSTVAGVAAPVAARQSEVVAQEVDQEQARFHIACDLFTVDVERHLHHEPPCPRAMAWRSARAVSSLARCRL